MTKPKTMPAFFDFHPRLGDLRAEVLDGLLKPRKSLPAKLFYDQRGSELFEEICRLDEYYPTRTEIGIFRANIAEIADLLGRKCLIVEYGSGNSLKIRILLDALRHRAAAYLPIDISKAHLLKSAAKLSGEYPELHVRAVCADYTQPLELPLSSIDYATKVVFFPGSTIGNFSVEQTRSFLADTARLLSPNGKLLIGVDLKKDERVLHAAYNDARGVTAEFNLNVLARINRELGADFDLSAFRHSAFYNAERGCIEMHLASSRPQTVHIGDVDIDFAEGETIHTEDSFKYSVGEFHSLAGEAGFEPLRVWTDPDRLFSVHLLKIGEKK